MNRLSNVSANPAGRFGAPAAEPGPEGVGNVGELMTNSFLEAAASGAIEAAIVAPKAGRSPQWNSRVRRRLRPQASLPVETQEDARMTKQSIGTYRTRGDAELAQ